VALLWPNILVRMKYYNTDVYIDSPAESVAVSRRFGEKLWVALQGKGFRPELLPLPGRGELEAELEAPQAPQHVHEDTPEVAMPEGLVRNATAGKPTLYEARIHRAEQLLSAVISVDPGYENKTVPENLRFEAPAGDLSGYDLAVVVYGAMREETKAEHLRRWVKNFTVNAAMLPMSLATVIFPFALPITISMPYFLDQSPDISWVGLVAFEPRDGQIVFINDFFYRSGKIEKAIRRGASKLMRGFPDRVAPVPRREGPRR
jgi:hypothetical protein